MDQFQKENKTEEIRLDVKSKILFVILGILIVGSVSVTYWRYMVQRDYIIKAQINCDPETENCFIWECDLMSLEEGEACTGVPDNDIWYYKIFNRNAKNIPDCDPADENCTAYVCGEGEADGSEELCNAENVPEGEECSNPEQYLLENPPMDEEECAEDDEECLSGSEESAEECAPEDEECLAQQEAAECEDGDEKCLAEEESLENNEALDEMEKQGNPSEDKPGETDSGDPYIPPLGAEPN